MPDTRNFEYDIAVSFAGEQRDYVRGVVRGLGDEVNVFFDENKKAEMLGEDLIEYFTDLYQHKARYVAMFVSADYERKMWTTVERRSALARAAEQRTAYILPIRMDDTQLRGLLPTIGFVDSRIEGLDGVINILREKLGHERAAASYMGRVPQTQADIDLLLALRPRFWEYWLYAGTLRVELDALESKYRDYELGFAPPTGEVYFDRDAFDFLRTAPAQGAALIHNLNALFEGDALTRAFGETGEPGDPGRIIHIARRFIDTYEAFMDEAARLRGAALPEEFRDAQAAAAEFGSEVVAQFHTYVARAIESLNGLPELVDQRSDEDEPAGLNLTFHANLNQEVLARFTAGLRAGVASLGVELDDEEEY